MSNPTSAEKYIQTRARKLEIHRCLVNTDWETTRIANVTVIRKHKNGNFTFAAYLVDLLCMGVKDTFYQFNQLPADIEDFLDNADQETEMMEIDYPLAHNIIFAGHDFAADYHIPQHPDFIRTTRYLLEEDDEKIPLIEVHTGDEDGLPHLFVTSSNTQPLPLARLKQYAGEGNYRYTILDSSFAGDDDEDDFEYDDDDFGDEDDFADEDLDDDDLEEEDLEEEAQDFLHWTQEEWKDFIINLSPANFSAYGAEIAYIHLKAITVPGLNSRGMDIGEMFRKAMDRVDWNQTESEKAWLYSEKEQEELEKIYYRLFDEGKRSSAELKKIVEELRGGIGRWPGNPVFRNYLYNAYIMLGDQPMAKREMEETFRLFPDYLMARTVYAGWLMKNDRIAEVPGLFGNKAYLAELYPERRHFHLNEYMHFNTAWLQYYLFTEDYWLADFYGSLLEYMPEDLLREQQKDLLELLMIRRCMDVTKIVAKAQGSPNEPELLATLLASDQPDLTAFFEL